jgi:hypothetical protein
MSALCRHRSAVPAVAQVWINRQANGPRWIKVRVGMVLPPITNNGLKWRRLHSTCLKSRRPSKRRVEHISPSAGNRAILTSELQLRVRCLAASPLLHQANSGDRECCAPASLKGSIMSEASSLPYHVNVRIQRPACPECHAHMMLARITPARTGFDLRTFECPRCDRVQEVMVATEAFGR